MKGELPPRAYPVQGPAKGSVARPWGLIDGARVTAVAGGEGMYGHAQATPHHPDTTHKAMVLDTPRFSFSWRGFYFAYFYFTYPTVGPSPHAAGRLTR